jgi:kynurenine formamidase
MYNGYAADSTMGGMAHASVLPLAEHGVVGRGVLIDMARYFAKPRLDRAEAFSLADMLDAAQTQGVKIEKHDILVLRTGWLKVFYEEDSSALEEEPFVEPGLAFSADVVEWFKDMEIPAYATDTIANEVTLQPGTGVHSALHASLMRNLGVTFHEILDLEALADDCSEDRQYDFLFVAAPLKVVAGTGGPTNPVAIK